MPASTASPKNGTTGPRSHRSRLASPGNRALAQDYTMTRPAGCAESPMATFPTTLRSEMRSALTVAEALPLTHTVSAVALTPVGMCPIWMVSSTDNSPRSITDTVSSLAFVTYASAPSGRTAMFQGVVPTGTLATISSVSVSNTETVSCQQFTTQA